MNKGVVFTIGLAIGAAVGSTVAWLSLKTKYERLAQEEIEAVREYYDSIRIDILEEDEPTVEPIGELVEIDEKGNTKVEYSSIASIYSNSDEKKEEGGNEIMSRNEPYVISPAEFGEIESYETMTLIYYNDGILADSDKNIVEDIESCIGYESLNHFGEYEEDAVYVRNDDAMTDYEVLLDESDYADLEDIG